MKITGGQIKTQASEPVVVDQGCVLHDAVLLLADKQLTIFYFPKNIFFVIRPDG
jgi:hypothetical protein